MTFSLLFLLKGAMLRQESMYKLRSEDVIEGIMRPSAPFELIKVHEFFPRFNPSILPPFLPCPREDFEAMEKLQREGRKMF